MSDFPDLDEVAFELLDEPLPDWRGRLEAACRAAGVPPLAAIAAAVAIAVALGVLLLVSSRSNAAASVDASLPFTRPAAEVSTPTTEPSPDEIVVHVAGAVTTPGVYRLAADARVVDAIDAAGGANAAADMSRVNLAAPLADGQQVYVVAVGEDPPPALGGAGPPTESGPAVVDINRATAAELEALPGIGPALAAAIVGHRDEHGPFVAVESLLDVSGIGEAKLAGLRDFAAV